MQDLFKTLSLFTAISIILLGLYSCEQDSIAPDDMTVTTIDDNSTSMKVIYNDQEYEVKLNDEGAPEIANLEPALAEIWETGHFVISSETDKVYLYHTIEDVDAHTKKLYPDWDMSANDENIDLRGLTHVVLYRKNHFEGKKYKDIGSPAASLGGFNNKASSMKIYNYSNRTVRVGLFNWPDYGTGGGNVHYHIRPNRISDYPRLSLINMNNKISSVWIRAL